MRKLRVIRKNKFLCIYYDIKPKPLNVRGSNLKSGKNYKVCQSEKSEKFCIKIAEKNQLKAKKAFRKAKGKANMSAG